VTGSSSDSDHSRAAATLFVWSVLGVGGWAASVMVAARLSIYPLRQTGRNPLTELRAERPGNDHLGNDFALAALIACPAAAALVWLSLATHADRPRQNAKRWRRIGREKKKERKAPVSIAVRLGHIARIPQQEPFADGLNSPTTSPPTWRAFPRAW